MRRSAIVLAMLLVTSLAIPGAAEPARGPVAAHQSTKVSGEATPMLTTWSFHKLNDPELVADIVRDVASGKTPASALVGLGKVESQRLLKARMPERAALQKVATRGLAPKSEARPQAVATSASAWSLVAASGLPDISPAKAQFADAYDKQVRRATVWFTANSDGHVEATLPTGVPFRIKEIVSYDGTITLSPIGPILKAWDFRKVAPFALSVRAGQQYSVMLEFAPEFALGTMMAGPKTGELDVTDGKWKAKVPLSGFFRGIQIDGVYISGDGDITAPTSTVPVPAKVQVVNIGNTARTATITADELPPGVTLEGTSKAVPLGPGETKWVDIRFLLGTGWEYGFGEPITLRVTAPGGKTSTTTFGINVVESQHSWEYHGNDLNVSLNLRYTLFADRRASAYHQVSNSGIAARIVNIDFFLPKTSTSRAANYYFSLGNVNGVNGSPIDLGSYQTIMPGDYATLIQQQGQFRGTVESNP